MPTSIVWIGALLLMARIDGARILAVFPTPSISHQVVFRPLIQELVNRGHQVTVITPDPVFTKDNRPNNLTEIDLHEVSYNPWGKELEQVNMDFGKKSSVFTVIEKMMFFIKDVIELQLKTNEIQELIKSDTQFDLLFIEACVRSAVLWSHIFKAPVIQISSFGMMIGNDESIGALTHPVLFPILIRQKVFHLTFWEKFFELYLHYWTLYNWHASESLEYSALSKYFGDDVPSFKELNNNIDMLFLNIHPMFTNNQPLPPNVISIWGIHRNPEKPLPQDLQTYLDSSKNGVIYMSLGSNARSSLLPKDKLDMFINVFSQLQYNILWKWEKDEIPGISKNVKISKWFPQTDVLRHPNLKLFITQGGLQSTDEAINSAVPLVGIPMLGDQWYNVEFYDHFKIGVKLDFEIMTEEILMIAITTAINDKRYKENIQTLRDILKDQPESALDRAVWWTEYVLRHGGAKHLKAANANMSWFDFYEGEFMLQLLLLICFSLSVLIISLYFCYGILQKTLNKNKLKKS